MKQLDLSDAPVYSRKESFDIMLKELIKIPYPTIIEIGCIRSKDDVGAGNSSELFAWFVSKYGGRFITVDNSYENSKFCDSIIAKYRNNNCEIITLNGDGFDYLFQTDVKSDLLYLDALDCDPERFIESAVFHFHMFRVYDPKMKIGSLVAIDDNLNDKLEGKGYVLIPYLKIEKKFNCLYSGYQYIFRKGE